MIITLFGATGGAGQQLIRQACAAGHEIRAVVRDAARLALENPRLAVCEADVMDPDSIACVVQGADAVVSVLGPRGTRGPNTVRSDAVASMVVAMHASKARRLIVVTAALLTTEGDGPLTRHVVKPVLGTLLRESLVDMARTENVLRSSGLEWTVVRPPRLTDGPHTAVYRCAINRNVRGGLHVSRADLADAILHCIEQRGPLHAALAIAD